MQDHVTNSAAIASRFSVQISMKPITIKICGVRTTAAMAAALDAGADMVGLVFHPKSPRFISDDQAAGLAAQARGRALVVALVVDLDDTALLRITDQAMPDLIQCHGQEDAARLAAIRKLTGRPVMKAVGVASPDDLAAVAVMASAADHVLLDAKPPSGAAYPGGHGKPFDWSILSALQHDVPFILSGGLHAGNVTEAIRSLRAQGLSVNGVDVSSGVESGPGLKDIGKIRDFIAAARRAEFNTAQESTT